MAGVTPLEADLTGKTVVITGASAGIGAVAAARLQQLGATVVPIGRSPEKTAKVARGLGVESEVCDFAELAQVRALADRLLERCPRIDVLVNNAGGLLSKRRMTGDGNEAMLQANHLGAFLLTALLGERLVSSAPSRVVTTSSIGHWFGHVDPDHLDAPKPALLLEKIWAYRQYGTTKLENILFTRELQRRLGDRGVTAVCLHPGAVATEFGRDDVFAKLVYNTPLKKLATITPEQGADTLAWLAAAPLSDLTPGAYYIERKIASTSPAAGNADLVRRLWEESVRRVDADLPVA